MERLQKVIAHAGVASRRKAEQLILDGKVTVNNKVVRELGTKVGVRDKVEVEGIPLQQEKKVYFALHKPRGYISAVADDKNRKTVADFFDRYIPERVYPVGRLDYDTAGVLLMTNDGDFANMMMHPRGEIDKVYLARVKGIATHEAIKPLRYGIKVDGYKTQPATVEIVSIDKKNDSSLVRMTIHEGRYHQVKKMLEAVNLPVKKLRRERFGIIDVNGLSQGEFRPLTPHEVKALLAMANDPHHVTAKPQFEKMRRY